METELPEKDGFERTGKYPKPRAQIVIIALLAAFLSIYLARSGLRPLFQLDGVYRIAGFLGLWAILRPMNLEMHEGTHYAVHQLLGYNPDKTIPWHHAYGFVNTPQQFVLARHNIINLLAPLVVLDFVYALILLADLSWTISLVAAILFIDNSAGSAGDIYGAYFDYKLPEGSLVYFPGSRVQESHIYEPTV